MLLLTNRHKKLCNSYAIYTKNVSIHETYRVDKSKFTEKPGGKKNEKKFYCKYTCFSNDFCNSRNC